LIGWPLIGTRTLCPKSTCPNFTAPRPELGPEARSIVVGRYLILYRVGPDSVDIVRIVHGAGDLAALLDNHDEEWAVAVTVT
jgi:hypothetical protein